MADREGRISFKKFPIRKCRFCINKIKYIDYKDIATLQHYITEKGKILSGRITGNCAKHQRQLSGAVKNARIAAIMPFVGK